MQRITELRSGVRKACGGDLFTWLSLTVSLSLQRQTVLQPLEEMGSIV